MGGEFVSDALSLECLLSNDFWEVVFRKEGSVLQREGENNVIGTRKLSDEYAAYHWFWIQVVSFQKPLTGLI